MKLEGTAHTPKRRKLARETALSNLDFTLYLEELRVLPVVIGNYCAYHACVVHYHHWSYVSP